LSREPLGELKLLGKVKWGLKCPNSLLRNLLGIKTGVPKKVFLLGQKSFKDGEIYQKKW